MVEQLRELDPEVVRRNLAEVRAEAGEGVEILVAAKYVPLELMERWADAGVDLVGENRVQDLQAKQELLGDRFTWDFIGNLQSRKVKEIVGKVRLIHSLWSDSALTQLEKHAQPSQQVLVQVNVAGEEGKGGVEPGALGDFIERCPVEVVGLMTMPPFANDPEDSRVHFARLAELAADHRLSRLSMGTTQDWQVAVQEGATTIRLGSGLFHP
ncbi:YggS family pyridoxal phosphate-dependent enzyme [soil metagenome]